MGKTQRNALQHTPHVLIVDGSKRPGSHFGGWSVIYMERGVLRAQWSGGIKHCKESRDAELEAIMQAIRYADLIEDPIVIVSDCIPAIKMIQEGNGIGWSDMNSTKEWLEHPKHNLIWVQGETLPAQKLAHHLANTARLTIELEETSCMPQKHAQERKKKQRQSVNITRNIHLYVDV